MRELWANIGVHESVQPKIYAVAGQLEKKDFQKAHEVGMDQVFAKPLKFQALGNILKRLGMIDKIPDYNQNNI